MSGMFGDGATAEAYGSRGAAVGMEIERIIDSSVGGVANYDVDMLDRLFISERDGRYYANSCEYAIRAALPYARYGEPRVFNAYCESIVYQDAVDEMDEGLREELAERLAPCSDEDFFDAYATAHAERFGEEFAPWFDMVEPMSCGEEERP